MANGTDPPPLPAQLTLTPSFAFVGRDAEWEALQKGWTTVVSDGGQQLVLIGGEAGAGKSRLAAEFARSCHADGAVVLFGGCDLEPAVPYLPWVQALDYLWRYLPPENLDEDMTDDLAALAPLIPKLDRKIATRRTTPRLDPEIERFRLFNAVEAVFADATRSCPLVVVIDDLHWAAAQTLGLLRHIVRAGAARMLIIATFRDTGDVATEPLTSALVDLRRVDGVSRIGLRGLDADGVRSFVARAVAHELDA
jgi:predicted ATPase